MLKLKLKSIYFCVGECEWVSFRNEDGSIAIDLKKSSKLTEKMKQIEADLLQTFESEILESLKEINKNV